MAGPPFKLPFNVIKKDQENWDVQVTECLRALERVLQRWFPDGILTVGGTRGYQFGAESPSGDTLWSTDGILQSWGDSVIDNVDSTHNLVLPFYIPEDVTDIRKLSINFKLLLFRAYSTGAASGGGSTSGASSISTTNAGGGTNTTSGSSSAGTTAAPQTMDFWEDTRNTSTVSSHSHTYVDRYWDVDAIQNHAHGMSHTHIVTIGDHSHGMNHTHSTPNHTHDITYGIYEGTSATGVTVIVDGVTRLDNGGAGYSTDQADLDISEWVTTSGWHTVELTSTQLGRINAAYFIQVFLGVS